MSRHSPTSSCKHCMNVMNVSQHQAVLELQNFIKSPSTTLFSDFFLNLFIYFFVISVKVGSSRPGVPNKPAALMAPRRASGKTQQCVCVCVDTELKHNRVFESLETQICPA